jgi:hypothetical protein
MPPALQTARNYTQMSGPGRFIKVAIGTVEIRESWIAWGARKGKNSRMLGLAGFVVF